LLLRLSKKVAAMLHPQADDDKPVDAANAVMRVT
jgi:hypothetical protein